MVRAEEAETSAGVTFPAPVVTTVLPAMNRGYVGKLVVRGETVYAVGGTYGKPVFMSCAVGGTFEDHTPPKTLGLRGVLVESTSITVVGEYGLVASTSIAAPGKRWKRLAVTNTDACLYAIQRDASRCLWVSGDAGLVLRGKPSGGFEEVKTPLHGRVLSVFVDANSNDVWILATEAELARWTGTKFVREPLPALRGKNHSLNEMIRLPSRTLVIVANGGAILRSDSDGKAWSKSPTHVRTMIEGIAWSKYGVFAVGERGTLLVSYDDARTFTRVETTMEKHLWTVTPFGDGILIGGDEGRVYGISYAELARMMAVAYAGKLDRIATLANAVAGGEEGAELVLDDALRERGLL